MKRQVPSLIWSITLLDSLAGTAGQPQLRPRRSLLQMKSLDTYSAPCTTISVSYTHLDVYKRQLLLLYPLLHLAVLANRGV